MEILNFIQENNTLFIVLGFGAYGVYSAISSIKSVFYKDSAKVNKGEGESESQAGKSEQSDLEDSVENKSDSEKVSSSDYSETRTNPEASETLVDMPKVEVDSETPKINIPDRYKDPQAHIDYLNECIENQNTFMEKVQIGLTRIIADKTDLENQKSHLQAFAEKLDRQITSLSSIFKTFFNSIKNRNNDIEDERLNHIIPRTEESMKNYSDHYGEDILFTSAYEPIILDPTSVYTMIATMGTILAGIIAYLRKKRKAKQPIIERLSYKTNNYCLRYPNVSFIILFVTVYLVSNLCLNPHFTVHAADGWLSWDWIKYSESDKGFPFETESTVYQIDNPIREPRYIPQEVVPEKLTPPKPIPVVTQEVVEPIKAVSVTVIPEIVESTKPASVPLVVEPSITEIPKRGFEETLLARIELVSEKKSVLGLGTTMKETTLKAGEELSSKVGIKDFTTNMKETENALNKVLTVEIKSAYAMPSCSETEMYIKDIPNTETRSKVVQRVVDYANNKRNAETIWKSFHESQLQIYTPAKDNLTDKVFTLFPKFEKAVLYRNVALQERALGELIILVKVTNNPVCIHAAAIMKYNILLVNLMENDTAKLADQQFLNTLYNEEFTKILQIIKKK